MACLEKIVNNKKIAEVEMKQIKVNGWLIVVTRHKNK